MYGFLRRPRWIVGTVLVVVVVVAFVNLGLWQLRRLEQRRDHNSLVSARMEAPVTPLRSLTGPGEDPAGAVWRRGEARGRYDAERQVLVRSRSLHGRPGYHVLTPLVLEGATEAVYVNRGWVPMGDDLENPDTGAPPLGGTVTVAGLVRPGDTRGRFGPRDPERGVLSQLARADLDRLQQQSPWPVYPVVLQLREQRPAATGALPVALPVPELSERNHLSYALQWLLFAAIAAVGWPLLVRRHARGLREEGGDGSAGPPLDPWTPAEAAATAGAGGETPTR